MILSPRGGPVMPDALTFEWQGYQFGRYTLRVVAGSGVVLERSGLTGSRLAYPADAPALVPGTAYTLQLFSGQSQVDEIRFEVADRPRADDLRRDLREVDQALGPDVPASSRAVMQAGVLASRGFLHDARRVVVAALTADADQPSLHALLGDLYARTGLPARPTKPTSRPATSPRPPRASVAPAHAPVWRGGARRGWRALPGTR